jgi:uncharacterized protein (TIRG00374 family)
MSRRPIVLCLKLLISAAFLTVIFHMVKAVDFKAVVGRLHPGYLAASVVVSAAMVLTSCLKWRVLIVNKDHAIPFARLLRFYLIGYYFTALLPSHVGGDVVRSAYAGRDIGNQTHAAISVFLERFTGLLFLLLLVVTTPFLVPGLVKTPAVWVPMAGALMLLILLLLVSRIRQPLKAVADHAPSVPGIRWVERIREKGLGFSCKLKQALKEVRRNPRIAWPTFCLTVLFYTLTWVNVFVSFRAFGVTPPFQGIVAVLPVAMVVAMIPIAPMAGLGLAEFSYVFFFGLIGVDALGAASMGVLLRAKLLVLGTIGWICHMTLKDRMKRDDAIETSGG